MISLRNVGHRTFSTKEGKLGPKKIGSFSDALAKKLVEQYPGELVATKDGPNVKMSPPQTPAQIAAAQKAEKEAKVAAEKKASAEAEAEAQAQVEKAEAEAAAEAAAAAKKAAK